MILSPRIPLIWGRVMKKQLMVTVFGFQRSEQAVKPEL